MSRGVKHISNLVSVFCGWKGITHLMNKENFLPHCNVGKIAKCQRHLSGSQQMFIILLCWCISIIYWCLFVLLLFSRGTTLTKTITFCCFSFLINQAIGFTMRSLRSLAVQSFYDSIVLFLGHSEKIKIYFFTWGQCVQDFFWQNFNSFKIETTTSSPAVN